MIQDDPTGSPLKIVGDSGEHHQPRPLGTAESWRLKVSGAVARPGTFTLEELAALPGAGQSRSLEITCVSAARIVRGGPCRASDPSSPYAPLSVPFGASAQRTRDRAGASTRTKGQRRTTP